MRSLIHPTDWLIGCSLYNILFLQKVVYELHEEEKTEIELLQFPPEV